MTSRWRVVLAAVIAATFGNAVPAQDGPEVFLSRTMPYAAFDKLPATIVAVGDAQVVIAFAPGALELPQAVLVDWIAASARTVASYYGRFPVARVRVLVVPDGGSRVRSGMAFGFGGAALRIVVGRGTSRAGLSADWILVHELSHLAFPDVARRHHWIEEGLASYVEPVARAQLGQLEVAAVWRQYVDGMPKGLPAAGDRGLDFTPTWGRTYWGGALFALLADIEIRERTGNRHGLQDALRAIVAAGGNIEADWTLEHALAIGDAATGVPVLAELYHRHNSTAVDVDLARLWQQLGIRVAGDTVLFDDAAPWAAIRRAITAPPRVPR